MKNKILGHNSYGSIPHLPGSRQDRTDKGANEGHARICLKKPRDHHDCIIVLEKLDGCNVSIYNDGKDIIALNRSGFAAITSPWEQHKVFHHWVERNKSRFDFLKPGERLCGEWMALAHGTLYDLPHEPFVAFDLIVEKFERLPYYEMLQRIKNRVVTPQILSMGVPCSIETAISRIDPSYHGCLEKPEGAVWRVERHGKVDFLAKYVDPEKEDGKYLSDISGNDPIWLWRLHQE